MSHGNILLMLQSVYPSLTKAEQKVADTVLSNPEQLIYQTITELAEQSEVGETTVTRICRKLGFKGFKEFKMSVVQYLSSLSEDMQEEIYEDDSPITIAQKISTMNSQSVANTTALMDNEGLQQCVNLLSNARKIFFFGVGSSGLTAQEAKYRFIRMGFDAEAASDAHILPMFASLTSEGDVVVGISNSGSTKEVVDALRLAKKNGCRIICISNHARSPMTQYADAVLVGYARRYPFADASFASILAQIHILDVLSTATAFKFKDKANCALRKTMDSVADKYY